MISLSNTIIGNLKILDQLQIVSGIESSFEVFPHNVAIPAGTIDSFDGLKTLFNWNNEKQNQNFTNLEYSITSPACTIVRLKLIVDRLKDEQDTIIYWGDGSKTSLKDDSVQSYDNAFSENWKKFKQCVVIVAHDYGAFNAKAIIKIDGASVVGISGYVSDSYQNIVSRIYGADLGFMPKIANLAGLCRRSLDILEVDITGNAFPVENMTGMFLDAKNLIHAKIIDSFMSKIQAMNYLFEGCNNLQAIDLRLPCQILGQHDRNMYEGIFMDCSSLTADINDILPIHGFSNGNVTIGLCFQNCHNLSGILPADILWKNKGSQLYARDCFIGCSESIRSQAPITWGGTNSSLLMDPINGYMWNSFKSNFLDEFPKAMSSTLSNTVSLSTIDNIDNHILSNMLSGTIALSTIGDVESYLEHGIADYSLVPQVVDSMQVTQMTSDIPVSSLMVFYTNGYATVSNGKVWVQTLNGYKVYVLKVAKNTEYYFSPAARFAVRSDFYQNAISDLVQNPSTLNTLDAEYLYLSYNDNSAPTAIVRHEPYELSIYEKSIILSSVNTCSSKEMFSAQIKDLDDKFSNIEIGFKSTEGAGNAIVATTRALPNETTNRKMLDISCIYDGTTTVSSLTCHLADLSSTMTLNASYDQPTTIVDVQCGEKTGTMAFTFNKKKNACPYMRITTDHLLSSTIDLAWVPTGANAENWYFGDSYYGLGQSRFGYYIKKYAKNPFIAANEGFGATQLYVNLSVLVKYAKPKKLIWGVGMNNPDTLQQDGTYKANTDYTTRTKMSIDICKANNIEFIGVTIPTIPSEIRSGFVNDAKNEWLKQQGVRVIDVASAIKDSNGITFQGVFPNGSVHPTTSGAAMMFQQFFKDAPDLFA